MNIGEHLLGRKVEHDERSRAFPAKVRKLVQPRSRNHELRAAALNQGEIGSCVGHTAAQWLNCTMAVGNRKRGRLVRSTRSRNAYLTDFDAVNLYKKATELDDFDGAYLPDDCGSSGLGGAKALQHYGFINEYRHVFDFDTLCNVVITQPVMFGTNWYDDMFEPDSKGVIRVGGEVKGGHEILIYGINFETKYFKLRNHWSKQWGINGDCFVSFDDMRRLMHEEGDITVPGLL